MPSFLSTTRGGLFITLILFAKPIMSIKRLIPGRRTKNGKSEGTNGVSKTCQANNWLLIRDSKIPDNAPITPR